MDWLLLVEIVGVVVWLLLVIFQMLRSIRDGKLLPIILEGVEEAEKQEGLTGEDKLNYAIKYIDTKATERGISIRVEKVIDLITKLVALTKKVNIK